MKIFTRKIDLPASLTDCGVPMVLLNYYSDDRRYPAVVATEMAAVQRATLHLVDLGHRRIGMIAGEPWMEATRDPQKGYRRALADTAGCRLMLRWWSVATGRPVRATMAPSAFLRCPTALPPSSARTIAWPSDATRH